MAERLFVAVVGSRNAGKSTTWHTLFGHRVKTGKEPRKLDLGKGQTTDVFLISGSNEERGLYADDVLKDVDCRIVLCSVQYIKAAFESTWNHVFDAGFSIYAQWLNPGHDETDWFDGLGLTNILLSYGGIISIRDGREGQGRLHYRVEEIRQYIHGWAAARNLVTFE
jgi:hypothetical protein